MFQTPPQAMAYVLRASKLMIHRFIDDLKPHEFEHQPWVGINCASWILGHLTLTDRRQLKWLGQTDLPSLPDGFEDRFQTTRTLATTQTELGDPLAILAEFDRHRDWLIEAVAKVDPAVFELAPDLIRPMFADRGEATAYMGLHTAMHCGQLSVIRRSLGYPPLT